jgi:hypothetical protein
MSAAVEGATDGIRARGFVIAHGRAIEAHKSARV